MSSWMVELPESVAGGGTNQAGTGRDRRVPPHFDGRSKQLSTRAITPTAPPDPPPIFG